VTVLSVAGGKVRLGITAPLSIGVHRGEVLKRNARRPASPALATTGPVQVRKGCME
jgi:sRNA-binding carbon storage regulator CsrA